VTWNRKHRAAERFAGADDPARDSNHGLVELDRETSLALLAGLDVGRLAWADGDRVMVFPLNFVLDGEDILAQTRSEAIFAAAAAHPRLTFQGDEAESGLRTGWTVMVTGAAEEVMEDADAARARTLVKPWRKDGPFRVLRIHAEDVIGRRLLLRPGKIEEVYIDE
jgi:nitroimidazol reductase NimA-like FMN-containing flavoprotein (pyridoxamine 5'-phosphate oxidase superfamily)